ncbi:unnamed protein product [Rhizopus stolonifer]
MMLPQFGFIVAQAGADSHTTSNPSNNHHGSSLAPLLVNPHKNPSLPFALPQTSFYPRQSSPSTNTSLLPPLLHPHTPFIYNNNTMENPWYSSVPRQEPKSLPSQPQEEEEDDDDDSEEELLNRWQGQYNDLITWVDNEFWEQADEIYQEKVSNLQQELKDLQKGTHSVYQETVAEIELKCENNISNVECFMKYQLSSIEQSFKRDLISLEDEYQAEKKIIEQTLISSLQDKRKQLKDQDQDEAKTVKRNLRKRNHEALITSNLPTKEHTPKKRTTRTSALPNIHLITTTEQEELENEFLNMKKYVY